MFSRKTVHFQSNQDSVSMLDSAISMLQNARQHPSQRPGGHQLLVIVSDSSGISYHERSLQSALIRLGEMTIFWTDAGEI